MAEGLREGSQHSDDESRDGSGGRRVRVIRSLGMPEDEVAAREQRRTRYLRFLGGEQGDGKQSKNNTAEGGMGITTEAGVSTSSQGSPVIAEDSQGRKAWETLVIGNLGENLSHIERKNREIEQQRYIVKYHEEHSPHQVEHNRKILVRLIDERNEMEDNEENNMPQYREKGERISRRLELLRWTLDTSRCEDERINIRAAIQGYESGEIPYSHNFTLLYRGQIVDVCPTYDSFCVDRSERLDRYFSEHGPGWLWHEPPLASASNDALAMKGFCIDRSTRERYRVGCYLINLRFAVELDKVFGHEQRLSERKRTRTTPHDEDADASCQLETLLDSGATFPIIVESDLARLGVDLSSYPAQGTMELTTLDNRSNHRFYEMHVSVCSDRGDSLVSREDDAVWPNERRSLGGFYPVLASPNPPGGADFTNRLSGMVPFDACYMSSAPGMERFWLGEDRRDVLGTNRLPAHLRYDTDRTFLIEYPEEIEALRRVAQTPDRVIFLHEYPDKPNLLLTDSDVPGIRGKSEVAIGQYEIADGSHKRKQPRRALAKRVVQVEPRKGGVKIIRKHKPRRWKKNYDKPPGPRKHRMHI
ncbi:hypothetical protein GGR51DRAFT_570156 [Nemania sp. FL0031]|nr:hypothetical protein GGR51DRAFT_570156 [Nemania sp. FL0031]